jgi:hypothetical protein
MFAETRWGLAMSMYTRLLGIAAVVFGFGLSESLAAGDVWKGSWKFELDHSHGGNPMLAYYDTRGRTIFRIYCGTHFETDAVYPGTAPKEEPPARLRSPTARRRWTSPATSFHPAPKAKCRLICRFSTRRTLAIPSLTRINGARWKIASSTFWTPDGR